MALWLTVEGDEFELFPHHNTIIFYSVLILNTNRPNIFFLLLAPRFLGPALLTIIKFNFTVYTYILTVKSDDSYKVHGMKFEVITRNT